MCAASGVMRADMALLARGVGHLTAAARPRLLLDPSGLRCRTEPLRVRYGFAPIIRRSSAGSLAVGVGQDKDPVSAVRGANGCSWHAIPFRVIPALGQVSENSSEPQGKVPWDVLQERVSWSYCANDSEDFGPKMTLVVFAASLSGVTERLAGVPADEHVKVSKLISFEGADVLVLGNCRPALLEDA